MVTQSGQIITVSIPIRISADNHEQLLKIAVPGQSFNGIVTMLIDFWNKKHN